MAKMGPKWHSGRWGGAEEEYFWQEHQTDRYQWLKSIIISAAIFLAVYAAHWFQTPWSAAVDHAVSYVVNTSSDTDYLLKKIQEYTGGWADKAAWERAQAAVTRPADPLRYMQRPVQGKVAVPFGVLPATVGSAASMHEGINLEAVPGEHVRAAAGGRVKTVLESVPGGKIILLEHSLELDTVYGNLGEVLVRQGDTVTGGQVVGKASLTGQTMVYFEVREKGKAVNPLTRLRDAAVEGGK